MPWFRRPASWVAFCAVALAGCRGSTGPARQVFPLESHAEAILVWLEQGVRGRVLVHIDAHDDFLPEVPPARLARLEELVRSQRLDKVGDRLGTGESELMHEGNFVYAARHLGLVREVVWVVAFGSRMAPGLEQADRRALREMGFSAEQVRAFRSEGGRLSGQLHGIPLTVCGLADLPRLDEPVLMDVDIDLFSILARQNETPLATSLRDFASGLRRLQPRFELATLAHSVEDGFTSLHHAWAAQVVRELLLSPEHDLSADGWELVQARSQAEVQQGAGNYAGAVATAKAILRQAPEDAAAHYAVARAQLRQGRISEALLHAERAGRADPRYELGLVELARDLWALGRPEAEEFLNRAEALAPAAEAVTRARGDLEFDRGQFRAALRHYARLPVGSDERLARRVGDTFRALGDHENALMFYGLGERPSASTLGAARLRASAAPDHAGPPDSHGR